MQEHELDARGLSCPLPVLKAQKRLKAMGCGDRLVIRATDPKAPGDLAALCGEHGHELVDSREEDGLFVITIARSCDSDRTIGMRRG
ncbi:MAG: sulfurtransferase TusA family protein [Geminicoccaceae bacterium]|nr:sulfurtransferase TusA family protein [Geminicoccaceae bacterium]MCB9945730.1 sulfurtransferase TusA family protein [Geminicoccaceae bacterium]